jgi:hypothetical protein
MATTLPIPTKTRPTSLANPMLLSDDFICPMTPNVPYRLSEVVHRLGREPRSSSPAPAGEQLRQRMCFCYLESGRRTNLTLLSQRTSLIRLFDGDRTQSYSHAHSDAGTSCLALYDLQPVTDYTKNQPHETKQPS